MITRIVPNAPPMPLKKVSRRTVPDDTPDELSMKPIA